MQFVRAWNKVGSLAKKKTENRKNIYMSSFAFCLCFLNSFTKSRETEIQFICFFLKLKNGKNTFEAIYSYNLQSNSLGFVLFGYIENMIVCDCHNIYIVVDIVDVALRYYRVVWNSTKWRISWLSVWRNLIFGMHDRKLIDDMFTKSYHIISLWAKRRHFNIYSMQVPA